MTTMQPAPCDRGVVSAISGDGAPLSKGAKRGVIAATVAGSSLAFIDGSVVNVALPALQRDLGAGPEGVQWVVNGYLLMLGALVLVGGAAADRFGRRRVFSWGVGIFALASGLCGLAPDAASLTAARLLQGVGAALLTPASLAILGASFSKDERGQAIGAWAGFGALTAAAGPVLGGWLTDAVSWRAIFLINLPLAAAALALTWRFVPESRDENAGGIDWAGAALAAAGLGLIVWALTRAGEAGFGAPDVWAPLGGGLACLAAFVAVELRSSHPMTPPKLFRSWTFSATNLLTLLLYFALGGALFFLPFELIRVAGYDATAAGAALLPFSLIMGALSGPAGRLGDRLGPRLPLTVGPLVTAAGIGWLGLAGGAGSYWTSVLPAMGLIGIGMTLAVAPLTATVMAAAPAEHAGAASGINNAVARIAGLLAVAALSLMFARVLDGELLARLPGEAQSLTGRGLAFDPRAAPPVLQAAQTEAFDAAYRCVVWSAAIAAALAGAVGAAIGGRPKSA